MGNSRHNKGRALLFGVFCVVVPALLLFTLLMGVRSYFSNMTAVSAANYRVSETLTAANEWLAKGSSEGGDTVERQLAEALQDEDATEKENGESALSRVRDKRKQLAEQARIEKSQTQATAIFEDAKRQIDRKQIAEAKALLQKYIDNPHAVERDDAQRLLAEVRTISDDAIFETLVALDDGGFSRVKTVGAIEDAKVKNPVLLALRREAVQRNIGRAFERRKEKKIAGEKRREAERTAEMERQRQVQEERRRESSRKAKEKRLRAEKERPKDGTEQFKMITTFPERYIGMNFYINGLLYPRRTERNKEFECFSISFALKSAVDGGPYRDRLSFITTEAMGTKLFDMEGDGYDAVVHVNLRYLAPEKEEYPVGYVTKIEFSELDLDVVKEYKAITLYDTGKVVTHPNPYKR